MGLVSAERGLSLRFPRFIKVRTDKSIEQASTYPACCRLSWRVSDSLNVETATPQDLADAYQRQSEGHKHPAVEGKVGKKEEEEEAFEGF
jgi:hypothetical protein